MNKFLTIFLRIIMILSFAGIIVFSIVAIINSQSAAYEAYNYVVTRQKIVDVKSFVNKVDSDLKLEYGASNDPYASFLGTALLENEKAVSYYINYLSLADKLSKGEQNEIISSYIAFEKNVNNSKNILDEYLKAYDEAKTTGGTYALEKVKSLEKYFINNYVSLYHSQVNLIKNIEKCVNKYIVSNKNYSYQVFLIKIGLSNRAVSEVFKEERLDVATNVYTNNYYNFLSTCVGHSDDDLITDMSLCVFIENLNSLYTINWAEDFESYVATLNNNQKEKANQAKSYFDANF